jgi:hypothetical protein
VDVLSFFSVLKTVINGEEVVQKNRGQVLLTPYSLVLRFKLLSLVLRSDTITLESPLSNLKADSEVKS